MMIDFEINDKGTLVWNDGSSRPATHQEQELTYEIAYRDDQIKALQAEVERLKAAQQKEGYVWVPVEPTDEALDRAVAFVLQVGLSSDYRWTDYMRDLYARFLNLPDSNKKCSRRASK